MVEHTFVFGDIALVFVAALACGLLAWRLRQPVILGYVLAGLIGSPLTPGPRVHDVHTFEVMADVGVILLMFSVGIEFSMAELLRVKWVALIGAPLGICCRSGWESAWGRCWDGRSRKGWPSAASFRWPARWC